MKTKVNWDKKFFLFLDIETLPKI